MTAPFSENITKIVNSKASRVIGLILGIKTCSNQSLLIVRSSTYRVIIPEKKGIPR